MKICNIKTMRVHLVLVAMILGGLTSCTFDEQTDPNGPSVEGVLTGASINQLNNLVVGVESTMRLSLGIQTTASGTAARELYLFDADPRNTANVLGKNGSTLENSDFYSTAAWAGRYRAIKNANLLIEAVNNTEALTEPQKQGYIGFAKTVIAFELIEVLKSYDRARVDVADDLNLGPILEFSEAIAQVRAMLDDGLTNLNAAGSSFLFDLAGFSGFDTPATFAKFNRGVAAVAAVYAGDKAGARTALAASHMDLGGDLTVGPKHVFSTSSGDLTNGVYKGPSTVAEPNNGDQIIVHNSWINDAEMGDARVAAKSAVRPNPTSQDGLNGTHETRLYATNVSPIDMLRNEELILVYAESQIGNDNIEARDALNIIRNAAGLPGYLGATDDASLVTEMLRQRRYSLWCENHRMFDLRRYNLSSTLPKDRTGDVVYNKFPVPLTDTQ
ncbi:SusD-like starch-binding protein associating with outer membrane [Flavobacteriaceae bacterium MAR_2010_105]|nr:SusD-like starch-binding protein associating with outer membrane [Flavobacteriaceae bacterium MAR_2010_105]